jgi:hypothetical protein
VGKQRLPARSASLGVCFFASTHIAVACLLVHVVASVVTSGLAPYRVIARGWLVVRGIALRDKRKGKVCNSKHSNDKDIQPNERA